VDWIGGIPVQSFAQLSEQESPPMSELQTQSEATNERRSPVDLNDPKLVDPESGRLIAESVDQFTGRTGVTIPQMAKRLGIGRENIYAYRRGHRVPTDGTRIALEQFLGLSAGALKSSGRERRGAPDAPPPPETLVSRKIEGETLVITTVIRIPLSDIR
jgi:transcriptional regulator with XRE-family HTH domain